MSSSSFRSTFLTSVLFVVVGLVVGKPIRMSDQVLGRMYPANAVSDQTLLPGITGPRPNNDRGEVLSHDTRQLITGRDDAMRAEANAPTIHLTGETMNSLKDEPFFEDYASANGWGECTEDFDDITWTKFIFIFLTTVGILIVMVILFWTICVCCIWNAQGCNCSYCSKINISQQSIDKPKIKLKHKKIQTK